MSDPYEHDEPESIPGSPPWADSRSRPWVDETIPAFPTVYVPGRPPPDAQLPCLGRHFEYDQEIVTTEMEAGCAACPARAWCLEWAIANNEAGIWAGTNSEERRVLRRRASGTNSEDRRLQALKRREKRAA